MKNYIISLLLFAISLSLYSQQTMDFVYLFDDFLKGSAVQKTGAISSGLFNYELASGKIHFMDHDTALELAYPESMLYIKIGDRIFEHVKGNLFYEKVNTGSIYLYIYHQGQIISKGKSTGYGSRTQTSSVESINMIPSGGTIVRINVDELFEVKKKDSYFLKVNGKFKRFTSFNSLAKLFKGHEKEIENGLKNENLSFNNLDDITKAVSYCSQFATDK